MILLLCKEEEETEREKSESTPAKTNGEGKMGCSLKSWLEGAMHRLLTNMQRQRGVSTPNLSHSRNREPGLEMSFLTWDSPIGTGSSCLPAKD